MAMSNNFVALIVVMVTWVCAGIMSTQNAYVEYIQMLVYRLLLEKWQEENLEIHN